MGDASFSAVAGFCAGVAEVLIGHPFDTIKTKMQTQTVDMHRPLYRGPLHCAILTVRKDGVAGLYRGLTGPLLQSALGMSLLFGAMDWLRESTGASVTSAPLAFLFACFVIGALESVLYCPLDHIKARLQVGALRRPKRGSAAAAGIAAGGGGVVGKEGAGGGVLGAMVMMGIGGDPLGGGYEDGEVGEGGVGIALRLLGWLEGQFAAAAVAVREIVRAQGVMGLYSGWLFQLLKEVTGNVALFGVYDLVLVLLGDPEPGKRGAARHVHPEGLHWLHVWPAGSLAGMAYYAISYPFDTLKTRLQTDSLTAPRYTGWFHVAQSAWQDGGVEELYRGLSACLLRAVPGSAVEFVVFEFVFGLLRTLSTIHSTLKPHFSGLEDHVAHIQHMI